MLLYSFNFYKSNLKLEGWKSPPPTVEPLDIVLLKGKSDIPALILLLAAPTVVFVKDYNRVCEDPPLGLSSSRVSYWLEPYEGLLLLLSGFIGIIFEIECLEAFKDPVYCNKFLYDIKFLLSTDSILQG